MKWIFIVGAVLAIVVVVTLVVGWLLPVQHVASRRATFSVPSEVVWKLITDVESFPQWRQVTRVDRVPDRDGKLVWVEESRTGKLTLAVERSEPPRLLVARIADPSLPFGGTWTYEITPTPEGCALRITENGEIYNPIFRAMARFVFGYEGTIASYLEAVNKRLQSPHV